MNETTRGIVYRPDRDNRKDFPHYVRTNGFYVVTQGYDTLFAYCSAYYRSAREVVADMIARRDPEEIGLEGTNWGSMDFAVWRDHRLMAVIHQDLNCEAGSCKTLFFSEEGNDPGRVNPIYGWPDRDEWIALGRPDVMPAIGG